ncbi:zinc finger, CCHC-type, retrotransposon gag domain protein [Tanacetum coccineum]
MPELTSHGGTMAASLWHQWRDTICGGSIWMHPSNRVNNEADPAFTAMVAQAVADLLPTLTTRITDEIHQNENNGNIVQGQVANAARNIEIFHDRPKNEGDNKRDIDGHRIRPSEPPSQGSNLRADDRKHSDRYGKHGRHGNMDRYGTDRWRGDRQGSDRHDYSSSHPCNTCGKFHPRKVCHGATGACFECGEVGHLAKDCKKGSTSSGGKRFVRVRFRVGVGSDYTVVVSLVGVLIKSVLGLNRGADFIGVRVRLISSLISVPFRSFFVGLEMPRRRSNCVNNEADPAFTAAVAQDLLPTLTARITDEIRQNENNGNIGNRRNSGRGNPRGSGNDGDAQPTDIHVWLERFRKEKPQTFSSASTLVEAEN